MEAVLSHLIKLCEEIDACLLQFNSDNDRVSAVIEIEDTVLTLNYDYETGVWS